MLLFLFLSTIELNFSYHTGVFLNKDSTEELRIFYEIPTNQLIYIKSDNNFFANYEISAILIHNKKEIGDVWTEKFQQDSTVKKINNKIDLPAPPGTYDLIIKLKDLNSQKAGEKKDKITVKKIEKSLLSFSSRNFDSETKKLNFEIYNFCNSPFKVLCKIDDILDSVIINNTNFINEISFRLDSLKSGTHNFLLSACPSNGNTCDFVTDTLYVKEPFWGKDWGSKVRQLSYIANNKEIDSLIKTPALKRETAWLNFWQKKESQYKYEGLETEYFNRVDYANANFEKGKQGWQTDRGKIYILLGEPDEIDSHPFEIGKNPYEIWHYYSIETEFIFEDRNGFGDYVITYPAFINVKFRVN
ncbi:MAG: GWxTD domain-containing protein [bacterium]|nr:GWxTD domain-containing protein [bacterium]